jgi:hypothetical protein
MSAALDKANVELFFAARNRDRIAWLVGGLRAHRDALLRGRDGVAEQAELDRRADVLWETADDPYGTRGLREKGNTR